MQLLVEEIRLLEARIGQLERELAELAKQSAACTTLLSIPGIGLLTATAMVAATGGQVSHFKDARHFASWFGLTPREQFRQQPGGARGRRPLAKRSPRRTNSVLRAATTAPTVGRSGGGGEGPTQQGAGEQEGRRRCPPMARKAAAIHAVDACRITAVAQDEERGGMSVQSPPSHT